MKLHVPLGDADAATVDSVGPKAFDLARLARAGLPVPDAVCLTAEAYRAHLAAGGGDAAAAAVGVADDHQARRQALAVRLGLLRAAIEPALDDAVAAIWNELAQPQSLVAVRSSALCESTSDASFAGQFDTFLGIGSREDLVTALRACWASLWSTRALRYMRAHELQPTRTAMAVIVQRMVEAEASGGALSQTPDDELLITGTWGLGAVVAQGEVVPDRFIFRRDAGFDRVEAGRKDRRMDVSATDGTHVTAVPPDLVDTPCLGPDEAVALARLVLRAESVLGSPVEVEWAKDAGGLHILQARALRVETARADSDLWRRHPGLRGQPAGVGWGSGRARIVLHEHDLEHVAYGDVLVTRVAGPALTGVLPRVAGVVAELGGSTSHLAALARERGLPAVLGALHATRRIPDGATVAVDGVAGIVRWMG